MGTAMWEYLLVRVVGAIIRTGTLALHLPNGAVHHFGDRTEPSVTLRITNPDLIPRLVLNPDLAVGEGYMDGDFTIDGDDIKGMLSLFIANTRGSRKPAWFRRVTESWQIARRRVRQWNPVGRAKANVAHHYDLSGALYDLFLDSDRQYSCAYFKSTDDTLERAQAQKKAHIAAKLLLKPGMRVLDIGCGWGGMALTLARDFGARVVGVTLSEEQLKIARARAVDCGLAGQVEFRLMDYRAVTGQFDRIVSVGMFEHVGVPHYREYFRHVNRLLTADGVALIHTIGRAAPPSATNPWVEKYIFPGGYVPALSEMSAAFEREALWQTDIEIWRLHYAETLRHWAARFEENAGKAEALYDARFVRMWRYYLIASEMTFRDGRQCVFQVQLTKSQTALPLTRDYMLDAERASPLTRAAE